jgi:hypothetical protein
MHSATLEKSRTGISSGMDIWSNQTNDTEEKFIAQIYIDMYHQVMHYEIVIAPDWVYPGRNLKQLMVSLGSISCKSSIGRLIWEWE